MSSGGPALPNRNQTRVYSKGPSRKQEVLTSDGDYVETEFQYADPDAIQPPTQQQPVPAVPAPAVTLSKPAARNGKGYLIILGIFLVLCVSVVALVAVILYRPTVDTASIAEIVKSETVKQFQGEVEALRANNNSFSLSTLSNARLDSFQNRLDSFQNTLLGFSALLNNIQEDLDQLRSVDLYSGCTVESRECTMSTYGSTSTYWTSCSTGQITIQPQNDDGNSYVTNVQCEITRASYMETTYIRRSGNNIYCFCQVTWISSNTHTALPSYYTGICFLRVTKCPRSVNLLA